MTLELTRQEINQILYCMESMQSDYCEDDETADYEQWLSALNKLVGYLD